MARVSVRQLTIAALLALCLALAACGSDDEDAPETTPAADTTATAPLSASASDATVPADPCALLPKAITAAEVGNGATSKDEEGETRDDVPYSQCTWSGERNGLVDTKLTVAVIASAQRYEERAQDAEGEVIDGVGDGAVAFTGRASFSLVDPGDLRSGTADTERLVFVRAGTQTLVVELNVIAVRDRADLLARVPDERLARIATAALGNLEDAAPETGSADTVEAVVACLEAAGLAEVAGDEDAVFDEVEFEIVAADGDDVLLSAYAYDTPQEAREGAKTIRVDPSFYSSRAVEGRMVALYGKALSTGMRSEAAACLADA